ncbi:LysR family transcriptional regulator [Sodalis ligni]|jgi:DNA-binding transcriptional LysR family regulator|uniref:DNA-binding transcriptional LysR family regulator n=1 Tax=Sodalis ligni TaxID=2697027 RepID=A0A4R1NH64_9GAMM|nr:LysR family transcriptional regulator [Sodalis ligni]QWA11466.1 LysR family transcriptional regulator [Sodalis ligni]TCL05151.1 DNA-binding transcriptional LysR family regulator [Sodalis ligni]
MDIKLLRSFVTLAELGSYHAAAEILCLTQPALTKQIQALEHQIGVSLFRRGRHGSMLTLAGKQLYAKTGELLKHFDDFQEYTSRIREGNEGKLALGFGISSFQLAPAWVHTFREQFPNVEVSLNDIPSNMQCRMLIEGQLQAGFIRLPMPEPLKAKVLMEEKLVLAVPASVQADPANIQRILEIHPLLQINPRRGRCLAEQSALFLKLNHLSAKCSSAADDIHSLLALIAAGNGVALLPSGISHFLPTGVSIVQPEESHALWQIGVAWNPDIKDALRDSFLQMMAA